MNGSLGYAQNAEAIQPAFASQLRLYHRCDLGPVSFLILKVEILIIHFNAAVRIECIHVDNMLDT